jgi:hypothetical protein
MRAEGSDWELGLEIIHKLQREHVIYALVGCIEYTDNFEKLIPMLIYVLICAQILADYLHIPHHMLEIIDCMVKVIGPDYVDKGSLTWINDCGFGNGW